MKYDTDHPLRVVIVGCGTVGLATGEYFKRFIPWAGVQYVDTDESKEPKSRLLLNDMKWCKFFNGDIYYICIPENNLEHPFLWLPRRALVVVRSTIVPYMIENLKKKYNFTNVIHMPSFMIEKQVETELSPDRIVFGGECSPEYVNLLLQIYPSGEYYPPKIWCSLETSALIKLMANAFLTTHITFWNEADKICKQFNVDTKDVSRGVTCDSRVGHYGTSFFGEPAEGKCLPKDLDHLIDISNSDFLRTIKKLNTPKCSI